MNPAPDDHYDAAERALARRWRVPRARYSDHEKQMALAVVYLRRDCEAAAEAVGIPARTLRAWRSGRGVHPTVYRHFERLFEASPWRGKVPPPDDGDGAADG